MAKSFLHWAGGKGRLFHQIYNYMPQYITTYIEPFVGGGGMLFQVLEYYPGIKNCYINDLNNDLISCYTTVRDNPDELLSLLATIEKDYTKSEQEGKRKDFYYEMRKLYNSGTVSGIENAGLFIFLNKSGYNGLYRVNSKGEFNVPCGYKYKKIYNEERILFCSKLLQKVKLYNLHFSKFMEIMDSKIDKETLIYLDPPYMDTFTGYTADAFRDIFQSELKLCCDAIDQKDGMFLLSNSDNEFIKELYNQYRINYIETKYLINSDPLERKNKVNEILVSNKEAGFESLWEK